MKRFQTMMICVVVYLLVAVHPAASSASPKAPTLTCPADVIMEGSHINCTCSTSHVGEPQGRLLLFYNGRLQHTGQYGQKVIFLSRDIRREDNNARVSCLLHWATNMSADRDWTLRVMYPPGMPSLRINRQTTVNYTTNVNNSVDFTCRVSPSNVESLELLKVTRNGLQILSGLSKSYLSFRIEKAGCGDSGIYYCRAGNTVGQTNSTSVQLSVLCSPKLVNGTLARIKQLKVTEGSQGQLTFEVMGYPTPTIEGVSYHQGDSMSKEEPVRADLFTWKCEQNAPDLHLVTCTLSTADAMNKDNGMYNVKVRNSGGSINVPFTLIVDVILNVWKTCLSTQYGRYHKLLGFYATNVSEFILYQNDFYHMRIHIYLYHWIKL
ncbi:hemicentin-2-like isoform X1 [Pomacea canaliculata]|uniref:hemicentin-2-like isoform X1 n=1 Tax=Pomacea canaliculata TaxID=400727 RepID=UPI000D73386E|nr:hemicentin-2-like isoform X1 [Pomacea canaliculata]